MSSHKRVLIMPAGEFQIPAIREAQHMGFAVVALDRNPNAPGFSVADFSEPTDPSDIERAVEIAERHNVAAIVSMASDPAVIPAAHLAHRLHLPGLHPDVAKRARNKLSGRMRLADLLPEYCPRFTVVDNAMSLKKAARDIGLPLVLKPTESNGSKGVIIVEREEDFEAAFAYSKRFSNDGNLLVEERLIGQEVSVESITYRGATDVIAITDKMTTAPPYCAEIGHTIPSALPEAAQTALRTAVVRIIEGYGIETGATHTEMFVTRDGVKLVELGARLGGGCITSHLAPLATGVNLTRAVIDIALGREPDLTRTRTAASAIRFITPAPGRVISITGLDDARDMPGVVEVVCAFSVGDEALRIESSDQRKAYVITEGATRDAAVATAERAARSVQIDTEDSRRA